MTKELKLHKNPRLNKILNRLVELSKKEKSGFSKEDKKRFIEKLMGYDKEEE